MSIRSRGVTLVELIVFMVIVGVALAGLFAAFNTMTRGSIDPQVRKQMLAIAESLMDEVALMPLTYCDPDDANAVTATGPTVDGPGGPGCATNSEDITIQPETMSAVTETRYSASARFDNVSDYHDFKMGTAHSLPAGIYDITGTATIPGLDGYSAIISVTKAGLALGLPLDGDALRITVTVGHGPSATSVTLEGYRTRYAPNTLP
jgi:MSHA pilin protein MshD